MDTIKVYLKELKNENSTNKETLELIEKMRAGDDDAKQKLVKNYLLYVVKIARKYMNMGVDLADLISEGNVGLMNALDKYDPSKGVFSSYAAFWIKQSIVRNCMLNKRVVRLPENISNLMSTNRWEGVNFHEVSIDTPNDEGDSLSESIADSTGNLAFTSEEDMITRSKVEKILNFLQERDAEIVKACYGIGREKPLEVIEAAELFNLSTTRINQILRSSLKKMRVNYNSLNDSCVKEVEIVNAKYGMDDSILDVTDKVVDLYLAEENIKASNRLGGDPCPGTSKILSIQYIYKGQLLTKTFSEGSFVKF